MEIFEDHGWLAFHLLAILVAAAATYTDARTGLIPNWLTFPVILVAPLIHGATFGLGSSLGSSAAQYGMLPQVGFFPSLIGLMVCGMFPAFMFYQMVPTKDGEGDNIMGGGDVKLFAGLGAIVGPVPGLLILAFVLIAAALIGLLGIVFRGDFRKFLSNLVAIVTNPFRKKDKRRVVHAEDMSMMRLAPAIAVGTVAALLYWDWGLLVRYYG